MDNTGAVDKMQPEGHFAMCDVCRKDIETGTQWKCANCIAFDMCSKCFETKCDTHDQDHLFLMIPGYGCHRPLPNLYVPPTKPKTMKSGLRCPLCSTEIGMVMCTMGTCLRCNDPIPFISEKLCNSCSWELEVCVSCSKPILNGSEYIPLIDARVAELKKQLDVFGRGESAKYFLMEYNDAVARYENLRKSIGDKSRLDMLNDAEARSRGLKRN